MQGNRGAVIAVLCCLAATACAQEERTVLVRVGGTASEATLRYEGPDGHESVTDEPPFRVRVDVGSSFSLDAEVSNDSLDGDVSCEIETDGVPVFGISSTGTAMCSITMRSSGSDRSVQTSTDAVEADITTLGVIDAPMDGAELVGDGWGRIDTVRVADGRILLDTATGMYLLDTADLDELGRAEPGFFQPGDLRGDSVLLTSTEGQVVEWSSTTLETRLVADGLDWPTDAWWAGDEIWVSTDDSLTRLDPVTGEVLGRIVGPDVMGPTIGDRVATSTAGYRVVHLVDPATDEYRTIEFDGLDGSAHMAAVGERLWVWFRDEPVQVLTPSAPGSPPVTLELDGVELVGVDDDGDVYGEIWGDLCRLDAETGDKLVCRFMVMSAELVAVGAGSLWIVGRSGEDLWRLPMSVLDV